MLCAARLTGADLVFKKGAGSALLEHTNKLGQSLVGMSQVLGEIPLTVKVSDPLVARLTSQLRTGVRDNNNVAHKLVPKLQRDFGVGAATLHGRTRQQRYSKLADYAYIRTCVDALRDAAEAADRKLVRSRALAHHAVAPIPFLGNGDAYDHRAYWENVENSGVDVRGLCHLRG